MFSEDEYGFYLFSTFFFPLLSFVAECGGWGEKQTCLGERNEEVLEGRPKPERKRKKKNLK